MKHGVKDITVVSLSPIQKGGWRLQVSANNYEEGVLIVASHDKFCYTTLKYFQNHNDGRAWINSLVSLDETLIASELSKMQSDDLKKK